MSASARASSQTNGTEQVLAEIVEEVANRLAAGQPIDLDAYQQQYPAYAQQIERLAKTLHVLGDLGGSAAARPPKQPETHSHGDIVSGVLGDYRILREIGRGGMGVVYEAEQISLSRPVALKVLPFAAVLDERQLTRFKNEAQAAAHLHHPNIVPVHAVGCERGVHYYAMQLIQGQTLAEVIAALRAAEGPKSEQSAASGTGDLASQLASGKFAPPRAAAESMPATVDSSQPIDQVPSDDAAAWDTSPVAELSTKDATGRQAYFRTAARLGIQVAEALDYAHRRGVVHRDIKPSNLLLDATGNPWVTDFGLARIESDPGLTMTGDILGTLRYMSPEQALAKRVVVDHRTDVYSLGVTLYELLTLQPAYPGRDRQELLRLIAFEDPKRPSKINRSVPADLETIVTKAMAKNPAERYTTAQELADDLRRYLDDQPIHARRPSLAQRARKWSRRHKTLVRTAMTTLAVAMVIAGALLWRQRSQTLAAFARETEQRRLAEENASRADENFRRAREAVDKYFTAISEEELLDEAGMEPLRMQLLEGALEYYLGFAEQDVDNPEVLGELVAAHWRISQIYAATGSSEWPAAYARSLDIVERLQREGADPALWAGSLAGSFSYGSTTGNPRMDQPHEALRVFQRGMDIYGKLAEAHPDVVAFQEALATNCLIVALFQGHGAIGQLDQAITNYRRSLQIWTQLARHNPAQPLYANHMCIVLQNLPSLLRLKGRGDEAAGVQREGIATLREIYGNRNAELAHILAQSADQRIKAGQLDEAEKQLREALSIGENLVAQQTTPRSMRSIRDILALVCKKLGDLLATTGRLADAEQQFRKACSIVHKLASQDPARYRDEYVNAQSKLIENLLAQGKPTTALEEARWAARQNPDEGPLQDRLRTTLNTIGDTEKTLAVMRENAETWPNSEPGHRHYGIALKEHGRLDEAAREFARCIEINPDTPYSYNHIAEVRLRQNRLQEALDAARSAVRLSPSEDRFHSRLLEVLRKIGDDEKTLAVMRENAQSFPDSKAAHLWFGEVLKDQGRLDEAIREFERAIEINRNTYWSHYHIAEIRLRQNCPSEALDAARSAIRNNPKESQFHALLLEVANKIGDAEKTLTVMRENAESWPDSLWAHDQYGAALLEQGLLKEAAHEFARCIEINPINPWAYFHIAEIRLRQNRLSEALDAAQTAIRRRPEEWQLHARLLEVANKIDDDEKALTVMRENAESWPDSQPAHEHYSIALNEHGRVDEAAREFARAVEINPDNMWLWINRGGNYASVGQWKSAASDFAKATDVEPEAFRPWYLLALSQLATDDQPAYRQTCAEMLERFHDSQESYAREFTAWTCALAADAVEDYEGAIALAKRAANQRTLGAVLYRAGQFDEALAKLLEADALMKAPDHQARSSPAYAWFFLAMTYHELGNDAEAHDYLERAQAWTTEALEKPPQLEGDRNWFRLLTLRLLRDEAEQLIGVEADTIGAEAEQSQEDDEGR